MAPGTLPPRVFGARHPAALTLAGPGEFPYIIVVKALLSALLLASSPAAAGPLCDRTGFQKTVRACGPNGETAGSAECLKRFPDTLKNCRTRLKDPTPSEASMSSKAAWRTSRRSKRR